MTAPLSVEADDERSSLLPKEGGNEEPSPHRPHPPHRHLLSSEVIRRTSVLLRPGDHVVRLVASAPPSLLPADLPPSGGTTTTAAGSASLVATTSAISNLVVATAGGIGMVTLPGSFALVGWAGGILLLAASGGASALSLVLLDRACGALGDGDAATGGGGNDHGKASSYAGLVSHVLGLAGSQVLEALTLTYCIGQVVAYLGAIGGQVVALASLAGIRARVHRAIAGTALCAMLPLSLLPEEGSMRFAGALGTACMIYIVMVVVFGDGVRALSGGGICSLAREGGNGDGAETGGGDTMAFSSSLTVILQNAPIFLFSMNAAVTFVPVRDQQRSHLRSILEATAASSLVPSSLLRRQHLSFLKGESYKLISASIVAAGLFYLSCSGAAYVAYCDAVPENVVDVWSLRWFPGLLARAFLSVELTVAASGIYIPLGRAAVWHLWYGPDETVPAAGLVRFAMTAAIVATGAVGSIALGGALALPLAVTSALCVTAQMFVLPGLCVAGLGVDGLVLGGKRAALAFAAVGAAFGALSLAALFGLF